MAKVKYYAKENSTIGTHSFYAVPIPNGTLTFDELLDEAMDGKYFRMTSNGLNWQPGHPMKGEIKCIAAGKTDCYDYRHG